MSSIRTVAVCGAGVMGSQLAALLAGSGRDVLLYDLNRELAGRGLEAARKAKPAAFFSKRDARKIAVLDYEQDLERIGECDWVIEAIAERLDWKRELYARLAPHLRPEAILTSNTSGLPLSELVGELAPELRRRFLITHFFNPPRYMRLVELVAGEETDGEFVETIREVLASELGKGVVAARDTPNFIANRLGIYGMMLALKLTREMRLSVEQVDAITGPVMGRPKSATYRTADLVGLDTLAFVARTAAERCTGDESRKLFEPPEVLEKLLAAERLGSKSGAGFYRKRDGAIEALDFEAFDYRPLAKPRMDGIGVARRFTDPGRRLAALVYNPDRAGTFAWELLIGTLAYAANRLGEIADDVGSIDRAMRWGFAWELGPFEAWDAIGLERSVRRMEREGKAVPAAVRGLLEAGETGFYRREPGGRLVAFDAKRSALRSEPPAPGGPTLADRRAAGAELRRNWSASLLDLGDGVGCLEFHSALQPALNPVDGAILDLLAESIEIARRQGWKGLVLSHEAANFSAGANLALILGLAKSRAFDRLEAVSKAFQDLTQLIKYAPFPVVAAPFNLCLGGGFELVAACRQVVAHAELYCGAVEVGVGLIPGAGGNLRLLTHLQERFPARRFGPMMAVQKTFETIGFARVSRSAHEARELGYLREESRIVLARDLQIGLAKEMILSLAESYAPPEPPELLLPGVGGRLALDSGIDGMRKAGKLSEHDAWIGGRLAHVLTGGERADGLNPVDEQHLLDLEREAFIALAGEPKSQERMAHMLKTGKPLRN